MLKVRVVSHERLARALFLLSLIVGMVVAGGVVTLDALGNGTIGRPPAPEFVLANIAKPSIPDGETQGGLSQAPADEIAPEDVEPDVAPPGEQGNVDQMVLRDDAGRTAVNDQGWGLFDLSLSKQLVPANSAASVAVMVNGEVVHQAAFGNRVPGVADPAEVGDRFRVASISKTITSIVVLQMVDDGLLGLDEPVGRRVGDYLGMGDIDGDANNITVRELLSHTSGFAEFHSVFFRNQVGSCPEAARFGLSNVGGGGFDYSNMNYCVLGLLIEAVSGKTYERVVNERLLNPLGITGMRLTNTYELGPDEVSHYPNPGRNYMETLAAAGQWNATPTDLVRIVNSVDPKTPGWKALSPASMAAMRYRVPHRGAPTGYGLGVINYGGGAWGHTGTIEHTHAMVLSQPNGVTWAVTVAGDTPSSTGRLRSVVATAMRAGFPS